MNYFVWVLPFVAGLSDAASRVIFKATTIKSAAFIAAGAFFTAPIYFVWLYFAGTPRVNSIFWIAVLAHASTLFFAQFLTISAHRASPLILTIPYLSLTPAFLLIISPFMGGGAATFFGVAGVLFVTLGLYIINAPHDDFKFLDPLRMLTREKGSQMMLLVAFLYAFTANLDYIALKNSNVPFYLLIDGLLLGFGAVIFIIAGKFLRKNAPEPVLPKNSSKFLAYIGLFALITNVSHMLALQFIKNVPYVIAIKRAGAIFFTIGLGLIMALIFKRKEFMRERENFRERITGTAIMVLGMLVIILLG